MPPHSGQESEQHFGQLRARWEKQGRRRRVVEDLSTVQDSAQYRAYFTYEPVVTRLVGELERVIHRVLVPHHNVDTREYTWYLQAGRRTFPMLRISFFCGSSPSVIGFKCFRLDTGNQGACALDEAQLAKLIENMYLDDDEDI